MSNQKYYISLLIESFIIQFKDYVKDLDHNDYEMLNTLLNVKMTKVEEDILINLIKKYFDVKVAITPISVPQCWAGIIIMIVSNYNILQDLREKLILADMSVDKIDFYEDDEIEFV